MSRNYNFIILSLREFEFLCRDLIQRKISEEIKSSFLFNSFSEGADGGIDAVFKDKDQCIILQCKRYKLFDNLYAHLRRYELPKVKKLSPQRYILAVSLDLSQGQLEKLYDLFKPYIRNTGDICGASMLNNLLTYYPEIELNYPRLFLSNIIVLDRLLNADVLSDSEAKINEFRKVARFYVQSETFQKALGILKKSHYVIISGNAGVGKSTMAGMISLYYSDKDYEFIFVRRDIREGRRLFKKGKKQLFFFDDFLGSTTFQHFDRNEDRDLLDFIKEVNKSPDKLLLITTREYVFRQAEIKYPELDAAFIGFQNASIKDFSVKYLRKRIDLIAYLIQSMVAFNQLFLVFTTHSDDTYIEDDETEFPHNEDKILLTDQLQQIAINKIISEYDTLWIWRVKRILWDSGKETYHVDNGLIEDRIEKLRLLSYYFPLKSYPAVKEFVISRYMRIVDEDREYEKDWETAKVKGMNRLSLDERIGQPELIKRLSEFIQFDPMKTIQEYYKNIRFSKEFIYLNDLGKLFPEAYQQVITRNITKVRREIKEMIDDDIDYYLWEGSHEAEEGLSDLLDMDLEELREIYKFKLSKKFMLEMNEISGRELFRISEGRQENKEEDEGIAFDEEEKDEESSKESSVLDKHKYDGYQLAMEQLSPDWGEPWNKLAACKYIFSKFPDRKTARELINRISDCKYYEDWTNGPQELDSLLCYLMTFPEVPSTEGAFYEGLLKASNISQDGLTALQAAAYYLCTTDHFVFRKETVEQFLDIQLYDQFVAQRDIWFTFLDRSFHLYLAARHIAALSEVERIAIYSSIVELFGYMNSMWKYSFELDEQLFKQYFFIPAIEEELSGLVNLADDDKVFSLLEKYDLELDFQYYEKEKGFELNSSSGGSAILEDIIYIMEWDVSNMSSGIEDCLNLSCLKDSLTKEYLSKNCPVKDNSYSVKLTKEMQNEDFKQIINTSGIRDVVLKYIKYMNQMLDELKGKK